MICKKISFFIILTSILSSVSGYAQLVEFEEKNFTDKKAYKEARRHFERGNDLFTQGINAQKNIMAEFVVRYHYYPNGINELNGAGAEGFRNALEEYMKAYAFNSNSATLNFRIAVCLYNIPQKRMTGLEYIESAVELKADVDSDVNYYLGRLYHLNSKWDKAIAAYINWQQPLNSNPNLHRVQIADANRKISECINGKNFEQNPSRVFVDNLSETINSTEAEYTPLITADESMMIFTSRRPETTGHGKDGDNLFYEDLYETHFVDGKWTPPINMGKPINSADHDATAGIALDGQRMYIYRPSNGGDIYETQLEGTKWSNPERMNKNINSSGHESSISLSFDRQQLYFVSDRQGGIGNRDIWVSTLDVKDQWGTPVNIGEAINTIYAEEAVFIHPDGKTMYFSSQGHNSMGGYDIFKSELKDGKWSKPENLGWPINGPDDDVFFVVSGDGKHGYYASAKANSLGEKDIYRITFLGPEKPLAIGTEDNLIAGKAKPVKAEIPIQQIEQKTAQLTLLKGAITDELTKNPIGGVIEMVDIEQRKVIATFSVNSASGKYLISLPSGRNYGIVVKSNDYLFHSENFNVPAASGYQEIEKNISLKPIAEGSTIVLRNVFFDVGRSTLRPESFIELDRLVNLMKDISSMKIEVSGHTDNRGTAEMNRKLSEDRAKAVANYLISKGIKADRIVYKGYGFDQPMAPNDNETNRQLNRRTEFKIISK